MQLVDVAPNVSLEVLDYGGQGAPVILLAGLGSTGHIFDDFAPRLTERHHVYAITRRGFGASSKPDDGYDVVTRVADDLAVLAALGLERTIWIGHSLAGDELTALAATHPSRVTMLVYLDATTDHGARFRELEASSRLPPPERRPPSAETLKDPMKFHAWLETEMMGTAFPFGETLAKFELGPDGPPRARDLRSAAEKLTEGSGRQDFAAVHVPALVFLAPPAGPEHLVPNFESMSPANRQAWRDAWPKFDAFWKSSYEDVRLHLAGAKIVMLRNSHHFLFIRSDDEVLEEIRAFISRSSVGS
ncbi:MAG: alpha/beta hydrolase [Deltaproteobacteria bacterium]|nr:alpha/beta hydrolase [Nannocystaceae bacterium]